MNDKLSQLSSLTVYHLQKHWPKDDYIKEMEVNTQNVIVLNKKKGHHEHTINVIYNIGCLKQTHMNAKTTRLFISNDMLTFW